MKRIIFWMIVICMLFVQITAFGAGALETNLNWTFELWWFQKAEDFLGNLRPTNGGDFLFSEETYTGRQSFTYEVVMKADVTDTNVIDKGWDTLEIYVAVDGTPMTHDTDNHAFPGKDEGGEYRLFDALFLSIKRYPASANATVKLNKIDNQVFTELAADTLTSEQRANGHEFNVRFEYTYITDEQNVLAVYLDGKEIATLEDCEDLMDGRFVFQSLNTAMKVTKVVYTETENPTEPETTEPETNPGTGDSNFVAVLSAIVVVAGLKMKLRRKKTA